MMTNDIDLFEKFKQEHPELSGRLHNLGQEQKKIIEDSCNPDENFEEKEHGDFAKIISAAISLAKQWGVLPEEIGPKEIDNFVKILSVSLDLNFYREFYNEIKQGKYQKVGQIANRVVDYLYAKSITIAHAILLSGAQFSKEAIRNLIMIHLGVDLNEQLEYLFGQLSFKLFDFSKEKLSELKELIKEKITNAFSETSETESQEEDDEIEYED